jgi:hypothetical protein
VSTRQAGGVPHIKRSTWVFVARLVVPGGVLALLAGASLTQQALAQTQGECDGLFGVAKGECVAEQQRRQQQRPQPQAEVQAQFQQPRMPTDMELHVAYCVTVLQHDISGLQTMSAKLDELSKQLPNETTETQRIVAPTIEESKRDLPKHLAKRQSALNRLQAYILPRIMQLDPDPLIEAAQRAEADMQESSAQTESCRRKCSKALTGDASKEEGVACLRTCTSGDLQARLEACRSPTWLPF